MKQWMIIGLVVAVIAAFLLATMGGVIDNPLDNDDDDGLNNNDCSCTIYLADPDGNMMQATVDLKSLSFGEMAMLSFGQGIRETTFVPAADFTASVAKIWKTQTGYQIWGAASIKITGYQVKTITKMTCDFSGTMGGTQRTDSPPDHATSGIALTNVNGLAKIPVVKTTGMSVGSTITVNQNNDLGGAENMKRFVKADGAYLAGDNVDGAIIKLAVKIEGTSTADAAISSTTTAQIKIVVADWDASTIKAQITSMSAGGV